MERDASLPQPFLQLRKQCCQGCQALQSQWNVISRNAQHKVQEGQQALHDLVQGSVRQLQALSASQGRGGIPAFASMSLHASRATRRNPLMDFAHSMTPTQSRVADIPVYIVVNKSNELVLVTGEHQGEKKQLGIFFFAEQDAQDLKQQVCEQSPDLGKESLVKQVYMSHAYTVAESGNEELHFRFMPDAEQVKQALQVMEDAGLEPAGFHGVPVFQATGLSIKTKDARRTPLFFNKSDLDAALGNAVSQKMTQREQVTQAKVDRARQDLADANKQVSEATDDSSRAKAEAQVDKAQARIEKYNERLTNVQNNPLQIEVGSFEEVLTKMEKDKDGAWDDVMFVPPGAASMMKEAEERQQ